MSLSQASVDTPLSGTSLPPGGADPRKPAQPPRIPPTPPTDPSSFKETDLQRILGLALPVTAVLAEREMAIEAILEMAAGTIIEFDVPFDSELTLYVANRPIASGQAVKVGENFGLRLTRIKPLRARIDAMGAH